MNDMLRVGVISNSHGIHGEVKVFPTTDDVNRFKKLKNIILDTGKENLTLEIESVKFFKQMVILKFKEFNNINEIEKYKGKDLLVTRDNAVKLEKDEYFIYDIIGANVVTEEEQLIGELKEVLQTGANDVYVVLTTEGKELLIPVIRDCVLDVDTTNKKVIVRLIPGLLD